MCTVNIEHEYFHFSIIINTRHKYLLQSLKFILFALFLYNSDRPKTTKKKYKNFALRTLCAKNKKVLKFSYFICIKQFVCISIQALQIVMVHTQDISINEQYKLKDRQNVLISAPLKTYPSFCWTQTKAKNV